MNIVHTLFRYLKNIIRQGIVFKVDYDTRFHAYVMLIRDLVQIAENL